MLSSWDVPVPLEATRIHDNPVLPKCTLTACRICEQVKPGIDTTDAIQAYRLWNTCYDPFREALHFAAPWILVEPFLRSRGYYLKTRSDKPDGDGISVADLLYKQNYQAFETMSMHTYPARDEKGHPVFIKSLSTRSSEFRIWQTLSRPPLGGRTRNLTMPAIEVIFFKPDFTSFGYEPEEGDARAFVVMQTMNTLLPQWPSTIQYPRLHGVRDVAIIALQLAMGVHFMHQNRIAHLDIAARNVLWAPHGQGRKYYFTDFEYARHFSKSDNPLVENQYFWRLPEQDEFVNPFTTDVFCLGALFQDILDKAKEGQTEFQWTPKVEEDLRELSTLAALMQSADPQLLPPRPADPSPKESIPPMTKTPPTTGAYQLPSSVQTFIHYPGHIPVVGTLLVCFITVYVVYRRP